MTKEANNKNAASIVYVDMANLQPNEGQLEGLPANPRQISEEKYNLLKKNIQDYPEMLKLRGLMVYPMADGQYIVVGGNMRYRAMSELGYTSAPCVVIPASTPIENLKAYTIIDNNGFGKYDWDMIANEWDVEAVTGWGLDVPDDWGGFASGDELAEDDDFDENSVTDSVCKSGEVWQLGEHRLMCGDSTSADDVAKLMNGEMADCWLTDPPYNVDYAEKEQYKIDLGYAVSHHEVAIENDKMDNADFLEFLVKAYQTAKDSMKNGAVFYIWHADTEGLNFRIALDRVGDMKLAETLIWVKSRLVFGRQDYHWRHEPCLYGWKTGAGHKWYSDRSQTTILEYDKPLKNVEHPTMKPVPMLSYLLGNSTKKGDLVLDTFGGSGSTMIAAEQLGRRCNMMEITPHYCDVIIKRWETLTGGKAVKIEESK